MTTSEKTGEEVAHWWFFHAERSDIDALEARIDAAIANAIAHDRQTRRKIMASGYRHGVGDNIRQKFSHGGHSSEWYIVEAQETMPNGTKGYVVTAQSNRAIFIWLSESETQAN
jgi:hypothetical protein